MLFFAVLILVCIFGPFICKAEDKARAASEQRAEQARRQAAAEAAREKAEFAATQAAAKAAATAARKEEQQRKKAEREAEQRKKQAEKLEAARQLAEYQERALKAEKERKALQAGTVATKAPAPDPEEKPAPDPVRKANNAPKSFPQKFAGEVVAFTGTLPTMKRKEAIQATKDRGGQAYETINTKCTLLVVGERPGTQQLERAERWNIPTITWEEWFQRSEISWRMRKYCVSVAAEKGWKRATNAA